MTDIHTYFGLSYANYLVKHRTLLQSMPDEWQERFVACLEEFDAAFAHVEQAPGYKVTPVEWKLVNELTPVEMATLGISCDWSEIRGEAVYYDQSGNELDPDVGKEGVPASEPIPHYRRGRTRIEPRIENVR